MSEHGHESHGGHGSHDAQAQDAHGGHGGHDEHGNGHDGHGEHWGDYNSEPLPESTLPPVSPALLIAFGTALTFLLCMIVASSFMLATSAERGPHVEAEAGGHETHETHGEAHDAPEKHEEKHEAAKE
jgi:hypothetical protein